MHNLLLKGKGLFVTCRLINLDTHAPSVDNLEYTKLFKGGHS